MADPRDNLRPAPPWKPGQSGNPAGSSKKQRLTNRLNEMLKDEDFLQAGIDAAVGTNPDANATFWKYIFERIDGPLPQDVGTDTVDIVKEAKEKYLARKRTRRTDGSTGGNT